jgi:WD40 repeat protein
VAGGVIRDLRWTPDGERLLIGADGGRLVVLRAADPEMSREIVEFPQAVRGVAVSRDGRTIAVVGGDRVMRVLDADSLRIVNSTSVANDEAWSVALNADGRMALVGERGVRAINIPTRVVDEPQRLAAFSRSGRSLVTVGLDDRVTAAELDEWQDPVSLRSWTPQGTVTAIDVRDGPSGPIVAARLADGSIELSGAPWLLDTVTITPESPPGRRELPGSGSSAIALSDDLATIVVGDPDNQVRFVSIDSARTRSVDPRDYAVYPTNAEAGIRFVEEVEANGTRAFLVVGEAKQQLSLWPATIAAAASGAVATHVMSPIGTAAVGGDGLFVGTHTGWLLRFELPVLHEAWERQVLASHVRAMAVHPNGSLLAAADDTQLWIVRASDGESIAPLARLSSRPLAMAFRDAPQQLLLLDAAGVLHVWNGDPVWPAPVERLPVKPSPLRRVYSEDERKGKQKE